VDVVQHTSVSASHIGDSGFQYNWAVSPSWPFT